MIALGRLSSHPKKSPMAHPGHVSRTQPITSPTPNRFGKAPSSAAGLFREFHREHHPDRQSTNALPAKAPRRGADMRIRFTMIPSVLGDLIDYSALGIRIARCTVGGWTCLRAAQSKCGRQQPRPAADCGLVVEGSISVNLDAVGHSGRVPEARHSLKSGFGGPRLRVAVLPSGRGLVEHLPDLESQGEAGVNGFCRKFTLLVQHPVPDDRIVRVPGDVQHPQPGCRSATRSASCLPAQSRHDHVGDQQVDRPRVAPGHPQRLLSIWRFQHAVPASPQDVPGQGPHRRPRPPPAAPSPFPAGAYGLPSVTWARLASCSTRGR